MNEYKTWLSFATIGISKTARVIVLAKCCQNHKAFLFLLYSTSICHQVQGHFHFDQSIVPWIESLITTQCVLFWPYVGVLAILKNKKKFGFFSIANPVLSYFQYIFTHCFTSKLRKIKRKDKEIKKKLFWGKCSWLDSNSRSLIQEASALTTALQKLYNWSAYLSYL